MKPFLVTDTTGLYDVYCTVKGGGTTGQAGAVRLGVAKALENMVPGSRFLLKPGTFTKRMCANIRYANIRYSTFRWITDSR